MFCRNCANPLDPNAAVCVKSAVCPWVAESTTVLTAATLPIPPLRSASSAASHLLALSPKASRNPR